MNSPPAATRWFSLRRHLRLWLLTGISLGWLLALTLAYRDAHHEVDELFDAQMVQVAQTLLALASEYDDDDVARFETEGHKYQRHFVFRLSDDQGRLLLRSQHAPTAPLGEQDGFSEVGGERDEQWRIYSQWDREHRLRVQVAESHHVRDELATHIAARLLLPILFGLPLLGLWIGYATGRGLAPVTAIADELAARAPERLDALTPARAPLELKPVIDALNALFARVTTTMENERRFTADAAHELRTPLAAILAQAQVAQRASDAAGRDHVSLYEFALSTAQVFELNQNLIEPVPDSYFSGIAIRPKDTSFDTTKMEMELGVQPVTIIEGLKKMKAERF